MALTRINKVCGYSAKDNANSRNYANVLSRYIGCISEIPSTETVEISLTIDSETDMLRICNKEENTPQ